MVLGRPAEDAAPLNVSRDTIGYSAAVRSLGRLAVIAAVLMGALAGLGAYTFDYGEGLSYFSTDPRACKNCHVMNEQFASWSRGPHHAVARCIDCHLPHEFVWKYIAKADNGYRHSKGFTFMDFHEPIMICLLYTSPSPRD